LTAHEVTIQLIAGTKEDAKKWFNLLKANCSVVGIHLSQAYILGKVIANTRFTKTQLCTNKETNTEYTIKSIAKKQLFDNVKSLVKQIKLY